MSAIYANKHKDLLQGELETILRKAMKAKNISARDLAGITDISYPYLTAVLSERDLLSVSIAVRLAAALDIEPMDLLTIQLRRKVDQERKKMAPVLRAPRPG